MPKQRHAQKSKKVSQKREEEVEVAAAKHEKTEALKDEMDEILDEIDLVLEKNAEEFVNAYVQKGGE